MQSSSTGSSSTSSSSGGNSKYNKLHKESGGSISSNSLPALMDKVRKPSSAQSMHYSYFKYIKFVFVIYVLLSMAYTSTHIVYMAKSLVLKQDGASSVGGGGSRNGMSNVQLRVRSAKQSPLSRLSQQSSSIDSADSEVESDNQPTSQKWIDRLRQLSPLHYSSDSSVQVSGNPLHQLSDSILHSKLFQHALKPSSLTPYYLRMSYTPMMDDITITTLITIGRLTVLDQLVRKYHGPVSVTLHLPDDENVKYALDQVAEMTKQSAEFAKYVDLHLVIDKFDRQFNYWRNIARMFARSDLIMTMDVDFFICTELESNFALKIPQDLKTKVMDASAVLVVPAFEFSNSAVELEVDQYPSTKQAAIPFIQKHHLVMFHDSWKRGHGPTDYARWVQSDQPYQVTQYNYNYEPYVLMKKEGLPWCDERFTGYGANKAACLYEIFLSGAEFWVMPDDFLIHQRHPYPESDRRVERKYNRRLYDVFREEACYRYGRMGAGIKQNLTAIDDKICGNYIVANSGF
ncbi:hypothetical protein MIR68_006401 [Amoeboaphelidium protococcarum]|nr:hypothetical protein MIR68_006401 [Amoeboaphelidium protococcarum]